MKVRIERTLLERAKICADAVELPLSRWFVVAHRSLKAGDIKNVATCGKSQNATRAGSVVCTIPVDGIAPDELRVAILSAVAHCEAVRTPPFVTDLVEGRDYKVVKNF